MHFSGNCDNCCSGEKIEKDLSFDVFTLLSCIKETGERFGLNLPVDVLRGSNVCTIQASVSYTSSCLMLGFKLYH